MRFEDKMAAAFADELRKIASTKQANAAAVASAISKKPSVLVPGLVAGAVGTLALQRAHRDWKMGRAMRMQQGQGY